MDLLIKLFQENFKKKPFWTITAVLIITCNGKQTNIHT